MKFLVFLHELTKISFHRLAGQLLDVSLLLKDSESN